MTEKKRYTYKDLHYMGMNEMLELVNGLLDENEELKQHIRIVLQNELNKSDIPVWKHQYVKSLAEKLGVELNELYE